MAACDYDSTCAEEIENLAENSQQQQEQQQQQQRYLRESDYSPDSDFESDAEEPATLNNPAKRHCKSASISASGNPREPSGCILADDMGLGKTLTTLAVLWAYVRGGRSKALVLAPSSVQANWAAEIKKWFGLRLRPISCRVGNAALQDISAFRHGHASQSPVLLISYDMFRRHAEALNQVPNVSLLVCDEAHKYVKNAAGTKTSDALALSRVKRRVCLTGTPLQVFSLSLSHTHAHTHTYIYIYRERERHTHTLSFSLLFSFFHQMHALALYTDPLTHTNITQTHSNPLKINDPTHGSCVVRPNRMTWRSCTR
jgi:hypothetical protein